MLIGQVVIFTLADKMKKLLLLLPLTILPVPVQAITWNQFWRPFKYDRPYTYYARDYPPLCTERVYHREYVPGTYWTPGYTRTWSEVVRVPCYDY